LKIEERIVYMKIKDVQDGTQSKDPSQPNKFELVATLVHAIDFGKKYSFK
jgi:hypothetical protein